MKPLLHITMSTTICISENCGVDNDSNVTIDVEASSTIIKFKFGT